MRVEAGTLRWVAALAVGCAVAWVAPSPASAQESPAPRFTWVDASAGPRIDVRLPDGWALYTQDTGELGLPLAAAWRSEDGERLRPVPIRGPEGRVEHTPVGPVRVYRKRVSLTLEGEPREDEVAVEFSWALCRSDLCVPGRTVVTLPPPQNSR